MHIRFHVFCRRSISGVSTLLLTAGVLALLGIAGCGTTSKSTNPSPNSQNSSLAGQLKASAATLNFGTETVGQATSQLVSVTNVGNGNVTITNISVSGSTFSTAASSTMTLTPGQMYTISVSFQPTAAGTASGAITVTSDASTPVLQIGLAGTGSGPQPSQHAVTIDWTPSSSAVSGYFVYRANLSGGPYAKLNSSYDPSSNYLDNGVASGTTYYYVVTSVDAANVESIFSDQVAVAVP